MEAIDDDACFVENSVSGYIIKVYKENGVGKNSIYLSVVYV